MVKLSIKLPKQELIKLQTTAQERGISVSQTVREMIRGSYEQQSVAVALADINASLYAIANQNPGRGDAEDQKQITQAIAALLAEIRSLPSTLAAQKSGSNGKDIADLPYLLGLLGDALKIDTTTVAGRRWDTAIKARISGVTGKA